MGSGHVDEAEAADGLRTAVGFYARKTEQLLERQAVLQVELEELQAELVKASTARDQLGEALREIVGEGAPPDSTAGERDQVPTVSEAVITETPTTPERDAGSSSRMARQKGTDSSSSVEKNMELWRQVLQVLATSGRPMRAKEIAAALGRPTKGKAGTSAVETVRSTCKRQVKHGRAVEGPPGVFEIARGQEAVLKGAA